MKGLYSFALEECPINNLAVPRNIIKIYDQVFFFIQEVDTALVKLYTEINSPNLRHLVSSENCCTVADTISWLQKYEVQLYLHIHMVWVVDCIRKKKHLVDSLKKLRSKL